MSINELIEHIKIIALSLPREDRRGFDKLYQFHADLILMRMNGQTEYKDNI